MKSLSYFVVGLLLFSSFAAVGLGKEAGDLTQSEMEIVCIEKAINKPIPKTTNFQGNILISALNPGGDDENPKITRSPTGILVVVYEQSLGIFSKTIPVCYSLDNGETWTMQFNLDSAEFTEGSGLLQSPDIKYNSELDQFMLVEVDPIAEMYSLHMSWILGDIANAEEISIYGVSGSGAADHYESSVMEVGPYMVTPYLNDDPDYDLYHVPGLGYWDYPEFAHPPEMGGFYYDGQSVQQNIPASNIECDAGSERMYMVMQSDLDGGSKISWKGTVTDIDLLCTSGGGPGGMDQYADIEVWPWQQYIAEGSGDIDVADPDISASGTNVVIAYMTNDNTFGTWDIKCAYSSNSGDTWQISGVAADEALTETNPAIYISGNNVICAYVMDGNLYVASSDNGGATWDDSVQINDNPGSVIAEYGTVDINPAGVVWTDDRNGAKDIYFATVSNAPNPPSRPNGPASGRLRTEYTYSTSTTDPNGDQVYYMWDWGDETSDWDGPYNSGEIVSASHRWTSEFTGGIKVKAKDASGEESPWSDPLPVSMPRSRERFLSFFENFLNAFPILRYLLGI